MITMSDQTVSIHPYFTIKPDCEASFREMCDKMISKTSSEEGCINYGFSFCGDKVFCRESYVNATAALQHLDNVGELLTEAFQFADLDRLEFHGTADQLEILKPAVEPFNPVLFTLEKGFRN